MSYSVTFREQENNSLTQEVRANLGVLLDAQ